MHFSKTYSQLLLTLPSDLRNSAIEYKQLKNHIHELVAELESLGLSPLVLRELVQQKDTKEQSRRLSYRETTLQQQPSYHLTELEDDSSRWSLSLPSLSSCPTRVVYELVDLGELGHIVPRLRLWVESYLPSPFSSSKVFTGDFEDCNDVNFTPSSTSRYDLRTSLSIPTASEYVSPLAEAATTLQNKHVEGDITSSPLNERPRHDLLWSLQERSISDPSNSWNAAPAKHIVSDTIDSMPVNHINNGEVVIPLVSDMAFFRLLTNALNSLSVSLNASQTDLMSSIQALSTTIAHTSRPASAKGKSDLYTWRAIFQLYMESQVFESHSERDRGERSVEDSEARLAQFAHRVGESGFSFKIPASREGLQHFLEFNARLMNLKKFQTANAEAVRKILKKHAKRTALPLPSSVWELIPALELRQANASVPHVLAVALTETLIPVIPHIDDYICLICTAIAFKPIRLRCGHFFCVRCLVKLQKKGRDLCPMCRAPTVLSADKSNVDHALINFMLDWFEKETKEKAKVNERESVKEEIAELGLDTRCTIM